MHHKSVRLVPQRTVFLSYLIPQLYLFLGFLALRIAKAISFADQPVAQLD